MKSCGVGEVTICLHFSMEATSIPFTGERRNPPLSEREHKPPLTEWTAASDSSQTLQPRSSFRKKWFRLLCHGNQRAEALASIRYPEKPSRPFSFSLTRVNSCHSVTLALSGEVMSKGCSDGLIAFQVHFTRPPNFPSWCGECNTPLFRTNMQGWKKYSCT